MCGNGCNNVRRWNAKHTAKQSLHFVTCHSAYGTVRQTLLAKKKSMPSAKQHEFTSIKSSVCVWEAQLFRTVSLNLTQSLLHVISLPSHSLHLCIRKRSHHLSRHH